MIQFDRPQSLAEVARIGDDAEAFSFALRNFLDEFYACPEVRRLEEEPRLLVSALKDAGLADAYLGGVAEHLARQWEFPVPAWARAAQRRLEKPWFSMNSHGGRMLLLVESPAAFRERNIFISADALSRA
jgi:hypothetical protein